MSMGTEGIPLTASDRDIVQDYRNLRCACLRSAMPQLWNFESICTEILVFWLEQSFRRTVPILQCISLDTLRVRVSRYTIHAASTLMVRDPTFQLRALIS